MDATKDFTIHTLGNADYPSPLRLSTVKGDGVFSFVGEDEKLLFDLSLMEFERCVSTGTQPLCMEKSGPGRISILTQNGPRLPLLPVAGFAQESIA